MKLRFKGIPRLDARTNEITIGGDYILQSKEDDGEWTSIPFEPATEEELNAARDAHKSEAQYVVPPAPGVEETPGPAGGGLPDSVPSSGVVVVGEQNP